MKRKSTHTIPFRDTEATVSGTYSPPTRETRMDPSEPAEFNIESVVYEGKLIDHLHPVRGITVFEADAIAARMIEECAEEDDEGPDDWEPDDLDRARHS